MKPAVCTYSFIPKDKSNFTEERFIEFIRNNVKTRGYDKDDEDIYVLMKKVYSYDEKKYKEFYNMCVRLPFILLRKYSDIIVEFPSDNDLEYLKISNEMYKKTKAIAHRMVPPISTGTNENNEEYYKALNDFLALLDVDDELVTKAKKDFKECYGEYANDKYLKKLYSALESEIEPSIRSEAQGNLSIASRYKERVNDINYIGHMVDRYAQVKKYKNSSR